ncbi:CsbD family protein [Actinoplanes sp. SE50]|nr:CsbD family protein [Actinoplanes sp. SE50/110]ATO81837.1 CsbD family protein [Actinoplanes sp. SE50]
MERAASGYQTVRHDFTTWRYEMAFDDKVDNKAEELGGKVKEGVGKATDDEQLEAEGHADQASANIKQAGEKIKDVFKS